MKKVLLLLAITALSHTLSAQHGKPTPPLKAGGPPALSPLIWPGKNAVPPAENLFHQAPARHRALPALTQRQANTQLKITLGENGLPIFIEGTTGSGLADHLPPAERALHYVNNLKLQGLQQPTDDTFVVRSSQTDEQGNLHVRLEQQFQGIPVWGGELIAHTQNGTFSKLNGRYYPTPNLPSTQPTLDETQALTRIKNHIGPDRIKTEWSDDELKFVDGPPFEAELVVYHVQDALDGERLAWHVTARPTLMERLVFFLDAHTGEILNSFNHTCNLVGHQHQDATCTLTATEEHPHPPAAVVDGPVTVQGQDLLNINRTFMNGGWQAGSQVILEDASKPMFNASTSTMPNDPVGAIITLDALSTSPQNNNFNYSFVVSASTTFTNKRAAISAHYNAGLSYDYFRSKFNRNSIDGVGGNIISFVNVVEENNTSMENAFWNGAAMWYGNGGTVFRPLARGLDVGGHEMTHGVVEKTANLVYQNESGALNESFADIFGAMIDPDDWKIGEDVMQPGINPNNCLRDLSNPHNGVSSDNQWWQPQNTNEQYTGPLDNGGVHINSGIPNHAFYLFANNPSVGKAKAEQVYYKALRDYLTKNSKFVDCRLAVIQAATDLYGASVANIAASAFTQVGIGGSAPSGNYLGQLNPNPGTDLVLCVSNNQLNLDLAGGNGTLLGTIYNQGVKSRPSITDNGVDLVFVNNAGHIIGISFDYLANPVEFTTQTLSTNAEWRSAVISKDGRFVAALSEVYEPFIYIFDLFTGEFESYELYNPTYSAGQSTGEVQYADVLEFDYSGTNLMYDAYNELTNNQGEDISYWDIGFLEFWDNGLFADPTNFFVSKLFSGLPDKVGIGNPTFAKNSPFIIAFDLIDESLANVRYDIYGANVETGDYDVILGNNGTLGWPNYNRLDTRLLYEVKPTNNAYNLRLQSLAASKIQPSGANSAFISNHSWGVWYGNGSRSLQVSADEPGLTASNIHLVPNPATDQTRLSLDVKTSAIGLIELQDLSGRTLLRQEYSLLAGANQLDINLQTLPAGYYILSLRTAEGRAALKLVKQ